MNPIQDTVVKSSKWWSKQPIDISNQRFGMLVAERIGHKAARSIFWICRCDCGVVKEIRSNDLRAHKTHSCGCDRSRKISNASTIPMIGRRFNRWTVIGNGISKNTIYRIYRCRCDCGTVRDVIGRSLRQGRSKSCGCIQALAPGRSAFNSEYTQCRKGALRRGLRFDLTMKQFEELVTQPCAYCGDPPQDKLRMKQIIKAHGIDRVFNKDGYYPLNCLPCCKVCNRAKCAMDYFEFVKWLRRVASYCYIPPVLPNAPPLPLPFTVTELSPLAATG